ncbi:MAG TPA: transglycosylase SLT domain-containing protein [Burkholderiales bacterium]|nr:transglycosylase SLT domain-containing protein [Burkholderiales bacterium]
MLHKRMLGLAGFLLATAAAQGAALDEDFLAARDAYQTNNPARFETHAQRLQGHLLEPYIAYWRLSLQLEEAFPDEVRRFLAANRDGPLSERLRSEWLKVLGERGEWALFNSELPLLASRDVEITCYSLQYRMQARPEDALPEARSLWFVTRELPDGCTPLLNALISSGVLTIDDLWSRMRVALEAGRVSQARSLAEWLPAGEAPEPRSLERAASDPAGYLERENHSLKSRAGRETVMFAVHRLARVAPQQAARHWEKLQERFSREERAYVWGMIGYMGALRHDPDALAWYGRAGDLSDLQLAWKVRAALRGGNWREMLVAVDAMSERGKAVSAWRYWKARALKATGRTAEATEILRPLAAEFGFYGQLALEELGGKIAAPTAGYRPGAEEVRAMGRNIGLRRALELYRLNLRNEANAEWTWAIRSFDDRRLLAAAEVARRHQVYDRAINTAERTVGLHDFELRYLAPYRDVLKAHTSGLALDEAWVYGLIRQESRFITDARSSAGATGLMQLMPQTARWAAKRIGLKNWRWSQVTEVGTNVGLGTYYLRHVFDAFDGQPVLASAAYNAGPSRARVWRPDTAMEGAVFAETIPFTETRLYVKNVMANATWYAHNFSQQLQSLKQRLGMVGPQSTVEDAPGAEPLDLVMSDRLSVNGEH